MYMYFTCLYVGEQNIWHATQGNDLTSPNSINYVPFTGHGSLSFSNGTSVQFSLGYNFFFDAIFNRQQIPADPIRNRSRVLQTVTVSFVPASKNLIGVILYSKTDTTTQVLEVSGCIPGSTIISFHWKGPDDTSVQIPCVSCQV